MKTMTLRMKTGLAVLAALALILIVQTLFIQSESNGFSILNYWDLITEKPPSSDITNNVWRFDIIIFPEG